MQVLAVLRAMTSGRGSNVFLFAHQAELATSNPLELRWTTGKGERIQITD